MANRLSDEQLRDALKEYGEDVGPITPTTRSAFERRLNNLRKTKGFSSRKITLNALSSDDSEIENSSSSTHRRKRTSFNRPDTGGERPSERLNNPSQPFSPNSSLDGNIFKKPNSVNAPSFTILGKKTLLDRAVYPKNQSFAAKVKKNAERPAAFEVETSDSDFDTDSSFSLSKSPRRTKRKHHFPSPESNEISSSQIPRSPVNFYNNIRRKSLNVKLNSNSEIGFQSFSPVAERLKRDHGGGNYHANGYLSNTLSNGELNEERVEQGSSTNYSHCISWLLLFGTIAFFIIIGVVYIRESQKNMQIAGQTNSKFCHGIEKEDCEHLLYVSRELHQLLTTVAGIYDCAADNDRMKRNMSLEEVRTTMKGFFIDANFKMDRFDHLFNVSVLLFKNNPDMGINYYSKQEYIVSQSIVDPSQLDVSALEAVKGSKSLWCRLRLSFKWTIAKIFLILCFGCAVFLCFLFTKYWKKRKEAQEKIFYEMVEKVVDILQDSSVHVNENEPCKTVVTIRDIIIPPKERRQKLWLWDRVVAFIEKNESRISVEYRTINGEDFKVWKWQSTTNENEGGKQGKVWQGQAFSSLGKGKNAMCSLSPCLKIRNMFDFDVEYEEGWQVSIQDAILEKCEGNDGIRHIAFDNSTNEGCVYMLCSSTEASGKAFNDLHGWWFDGKLVTVKYIPLKRYLERFPESEHCIEPLRPSNNKRLSLSTPFFSSALERS